MAEQTEPTTPATKLTELWEDCMAALNEPHRDCTCDYCQLPRPSAGQTVIQDNDNCLTPSTMCNPCRKSFNYMKEFLPEAKLLAKPGTYPIYFIGRFPLQTAQTSTPRDLIRYMDGVFERVGARLSARYPGMTADDVRMFECKALPSPEANGIYGSSLLVDFPERVGVDEALVEMVFGPVGERMGGWTGVAHRMGQCLSEYRLTWFKVMYDIQTMKVDVRT
ncbi:hypothetical protein BDV18DRAFT_161050 [Aspergillus unguis]